MKPKRRYYQFHGHNPRYRKQYDFHVPKTLIILGKAVSVEYETDKRHGGGDGKPCIYKHDFETPAYVCMDETGKKQLYIVGNQLIITEAGIEN